MKYCSNVGSGFNINVNLKKFVVQYTKFKNNIFIN